MEQYQTQQQTAQYALRRPAYYAQRIRRGTSPRLFRASWTQYRGYLRTGIDDPACDADVIEWLEAIIAEKVNDSRSVFYIRG